MSSLLLELDSVSLEVGGASTELLLDLALELEDFAELLLDSGSLPGMTDEEQLDFTELDDTLVSFSSFDDEDFAFSLLDEFFWMLELEDFAKLLLDSGSLLAMTEEELSFFDELLLSTLTNSPFGPEEDESSPQATIQAIAATRMDPIALRLQDDGTINLFISPPTNPK